MTTDDSATTHAFTNRLCQERSPYLLQHAHNPVDWYPWGEVAFARARDQDKPIFLSIGYSACHWCHVMERESFENPAVARILNDRFVSIKVDREERPDVNEIYMTVVQMISGSGGWPLSVFLLPDGRPFYGGTYFPPETRQGRIGFSSLITQLADAYAARRAEVEESGNGMVGELRKLARQRPLPVEGEGQPTTASDLLNLAVQDMKERFDEANGGFGGAPKFPPHHALRLLTIAARGGDSDAPRLLTRTLDQMALGGIYDQIGGGFHRYATDTVWLLPHFEKMLYDNALLARVYAEAYDLTGNPAYARIARETCDWVLRDLLDEQGGFQAALDADSEGEEGKYYVWTESEVRAILPRSPADRVTAAYQFRPGGNYHDEATGQGTSANIPFLSIGRSDTPLPAALDDTLAIGRAALLEARYDRVPPGRDDKVITAWNGLMIGALAVCGTAVGEPRYTQASRRAAEFCLSVLRTGDGMLLRRYAKGHAGIPAYLDDYAFLGDGLMDLYDATGDPRWATAAAELADTLLADFRDPDDQGFFYTATGHETLIARTKDMFDGALPSSNGVAARLLARLARQPGSERFGVVADTTLAAYAGLMARAPQGAATLIETAILRETAASAIPAHSRPVEWNLEGSAAETVRAGETLTLAGVLTIAPGYHVNARVPTTTNAVPTTVTFASDAPAAIGPATYPRAQTREIGGEVLSVYEGPARFSVPVTIPRDAVAGKYAVALTVRCQPCSESECLPTFESTVRLTLTIRGSG